MQTLDLDRAGNLLPDLVDAVRRGQEVILTQGDQPIARMIPLVTPPPRPQFDSARGLVRIAEDFDAPLADFDEYTS